MMDRKVQDLIEKEKLRQRGVVNLIASENYVSPAVMEALGSELTNKYAEGLPGARYYGGNGTVDLIELLTQKRALKAFNLSEKRWDVNVQPLSGTPANLAVYLATLKPGDKIMGMSLDQGGHLSHGFRASITGMFWRQIAYGVDPKTERLDYGSLKSLAQKERPHLIVAGFTAYPRKINWKRFREIADCCGAHLHVDMSHIAGLVAGGVHPSPFRYADTVMTTTHKTLRGPRSAIIWSRKDGRRLGEAVNRAIFPGLQGGPHVNQIAATAVALREANSKDFKLYAEKVVKNAKVLANSLKSKGWRVVSGGTDTHLILIDTWMGGGGVSGKQASERLERDGIIVNKNAIPGETRSSFDPSGIRLGTAAETSRGMVGSDFVEVATRIDRSLRKR